ncbi:type IV pilus assembly protein PilM, partial [Patescibacteria group bacterium]|nr:type IV pilus assembly protein PilM [Patescibacteria group bacterium]
MKDFLGIDVGRGSIKIVALSKEAESLELRGIGETQTNNTDWTSGDNKQIKELASDIKLLLRDMKLKDSFAAVSLPENEVISRLVKLPPLKKNEIKEALRFEAETFVPYPLDEVSIDYDVVEEDEAGRLLVFAIAAKNNLIQYYLKLFKSVGVELLSLESSSLAIKRVANQVVGTESHVLLMDIGEKYSSVVCLNKGQIYYTRTIPAGGESLTRSISVNLGLDMVSAEEYKKAYGMNPLELEGKIKNAVLPVFNSIAEELRKTIVSYREEWQNSIGLLILSGGGANMPGFAEELTKVLGIEVQVMQPFLRVDTTKLVLPV